MKFLLDTNVVSELRKIRAGKADAKVAAWAESVNASDLFLSAITIQELELGILLLDHRDPSQGIMFRIWLNEQVLPAFSGRILPVDVKIAQHCAKLHVPNPRPLADSLIAATALVYDMTVVTRNVADL